LIIDSKPIKKCNEKRRVNSSMVSHIHITKNRVFFLLFYLDTIFDFFCLTSFFISEIVSQIIFYWLPICRYVLYPTNYFSYIPYECGDYIICHEHKILFFYFQFESLNNKCIYKKTFQSLFPQFINATSS